MDIKGKLKSKLIKTACVVGGVVLTASAIAGVIIGPIRGYSVYEESSTVSSSGIVNITTDDAWDQFIEYIHQAEGGGTIYKNASGVDCYKVQSDGGGGSAVGYGVDIATHGHRFTSLGYSTSIGSLIPVEVVDPVEKEEIEELYEQVNNLASSNGITLTTYQIFALMSRTYNYGFTGGTGQATWAFRYPSTLTFVQAYKQYYSSINNADYYGDYTKTDFNNQLYTQYMTHLAYVGGGTPDGWITRRKSEWCLFQTGYFGWGLKNGEYPAGFDEYCSGGGAGGTIGVGGTIASLSGQSPFTHSYTSTVTGKTHYIMQQGSVSGWGGYCNRGLGVILASGYADKNTVLSTAKSDSNIFCNGASPSNNFLGKFGLTCTSINGTSLRSAIDTYTKNGKVVVFRILGAEGGYGACYIDGQKWASQAHWVSILDLKIENGEEYAFIGESSYVSSGNSPWVKVSSLISNEYKIDSGTLYVVSEK